MPVNRDQWGRARDVFDAAVLRPRIEREAYLDSACGGDSVLRAEVASLLAAHDRSASFIERPAFEEGADLLAGDSVDLLDGRQIGPYIVRHVIGRGGMGVVYLADDTRLSRRVALKALAPEVGKDPRRRERLRQEARAAAALSHPNIATVYSLEEIGDELYLATEHVSGPTLKALVDQSPIPFSDLVEIAAQVARALAAAHAQGVVHRDLKPENVVRTTAGIVKLLDFGIARMEGLLPVDLTADGDALGTPAYMAPEQIRAGKVDFRADLFSFGVLVYELASGSNPFESETPTATMARILEVDPLPLSEVCRADLSALDPIVAQCLSKDPAGRPSSTSELVTAIEALPARPSPEHRREHVQHASAGTARWWWEFHQGAMSALNILVMYPVWRVRLWLAPSWGTLFLLLVLACAAASTTVRLHLWFTSRFYASELSTELPLARRWTRLCDAGIIVVLLAATFQVGIDHQIIAMLFVTVAIGYAAASLVIEPTATRAAFSS